MPPRGDPIKPVKDSEGKITGYTTRVDGPPDPVTGKRKQIRITRPTKREVSAERSRVAHESRVGTYVAPSKAVVNDELDGWLAAVTGDVEAATASNYRHALKPVRERLGHRKVQSLTRADVVDLVNWMSREGRKRGGQVGTGLGPRAVQLTLGRFRSFLEDCVDRRLLPLNPAKNVRPPKQSSRRSKAWSVKEVRAFLTHEDVVEDRLYAGSRLNLLGMRPEEIVGLRWEDCELDGQREPDLDSEDEVRPEGPHIRITNVRTLVDGVMVEKATKSASGERVLLLDPGIAAALRSLKARQAAERLAAGPAYTYTGYVIVDELGQPVRTDWWRRYTYRLMAAAGVRKVRLYDSRHTCLTAMVNAGVPLHIVAAWAGHSDGSITLKHYIRAQTEDLGVARDALAKLFG